MFFYVEKEVIIEKKVCAEMVLQKFEIAFLKKIICYEATIGTKLHATF